MLRELFDLLRDRGSRDARRLGHDREAISIASRHRRCHAAWAPHLASVRRLILEASQAATGRENALILGSGLCLDVPVVELSQRFATVYLVDNHHPRAARTLSRRFPNVRLVGAEVTGMAQTAERVRKRKADLPSPLPLPSVLPEVRPDFTASVNLTSQLAIPFYRLLGRHVGARQLAAFARGLIEAHLTWLARQPGQVCLVCDVAWQRADGERILETRDALEGVILPPPDESWIWRIAPRPEESLAYDRQNLVWAYRDFVAAGGFDREGWPAQRVLAAKRASSAKA